MIKISSVYIPIEISSISKEEEKPSCTYKLDLDTGRIRGKVDELEAVNQAIRKAIITPRFKCLIYDNQYGSEIENVFIANDATREYIETAVEGFIKDALITDSRILEVYDFSVSFEDEKAYINFSVKTIYGETEIEEVI